MYLDKHVSRFLFIEFPRNILSYFYSTHVLNTRFGVVLYAFLHHFTHFTRFLPILPIGDFQAF